MAAAESGEQRAAESGEQRAADLRRQAGEHQAKAEQLRALAARVEQGNAGERHVGALLDVLADAGWRVLHDRYKTAGSPANLDHLAVGPPGVFVLDSKNWTGGPLRLDEHGMALGRYRRDQELHAARAAADLVAHHVRTILTPVDVRPVLVFAGDVGLPGPAVHHGVVLLHADQLPGWLTAQPPVLTAQQVHQAASTLDAALPPRAGDRQPLHLPPDLTTGPGSPRRRTPPTPAGRPGRRSRGSRGSSADPDRRGRRRTRAGSTPVRGPAWELRRLARALVVLALLLLVGLPAVGRLLDAAVDRGSSSTPPGTTTPAATAPPTP